MAEAKTILVVDDELDERTWMTAFFEDNGYLTRSAVDGEDGFAQAKAGVDLITLDITMDNQSGVRMFKNLQQAPETQDIPVIMVTGVAGEFKQFLERTRQVTSPAGYFEKPVDRDELLAKVRDLIG